MPEVVWHYLENQFDNATKKNRRLMHDILTDHHAKLTGAAVANAGLGPLVTALQPAYEGWQTKYGGWKNARAAYRSATQAVDLLFEQLQVEPTGGGRSKLDAWESQIAAHWGGNDPVYDFLFPQGRAPFREGTTDEILGEVQRLGQRLEVKRVEVADVLDGGGLTGEALTAAQEQLAMLEVLAPRVTAFYTQVSTARTVQTQKEGLVDQLSGQVEPARVAAAVALYRNLGSLMALFATNPAEVEGFFDLTLIIEPADDGDEEEPEPGSSSSSSSSSSSGGTP